MPDPFLTRINSLLYESSMHACVCIVHCSLSLVSSNRIQSQGGVSILLYYVTADLTDFDVGI